MVRLRRHQRRAVEARLRSAARCLVAALVALGLPVLAPAEEPAPGGIRFVDRAADAGLIHVIWCGRDEKPHLLESGGSGLALFDYDLDGDLDLYVVNGWRLAGSEVVERGRNRLYRNRGDGTFDEVGASAGVDDDGWGTGVAVGDVDGDGAPDLFVANFGPDVLYRNRGDGTFARVAGGPSFDGWTTGAVLFDADRDGDADLFVAAYVDATLDEVLRAVPRLHWHGRLVMLGPFGLEGAGNLYFRNVGGGRFEERTREAGLVDAGLFYSFGVAAVDLDGDLDLDLYVANDSNPNYLYENAGDGSFREVGLWSGAALDGRGNAQAGMGLAVGDLESDGLPELLVTNFHTDVSTLYRNLGDLLFDDVTDRLGLRDPTYGPLSWGASLADFDLDGRLDLFIANGHIYPQADDVPAVSGRFRQRNTLLRGTASGFVDVAADSGPGLAVEQSSRGLAQGDVDGDGDLDLAISNIDAPPTLLVNETPRPGDWLLLDAPAAARASAVVGDGVVLRHRVTGGSYVSTGDARLHFGFGSAARIDSLQVLFADGQRLELRDLPVDRVVLLRP